ARASMTSSTTSFIAVYWQPTTGNWLLATDYWLLTTGHPLLLARHLVDDAHSFDAAALQTVDDVEQFLQRDASVAAQVDLLVAAGHHQLADTLGQHVDPY